MEEGNNARRIRGCLCGCKEDLTLGHREQGEADGK